MNSTMNRQQTNVYQGNENKLSILLSSRIRLNEEEKASLKAAYQKARSGYQPAQGASVNGSSLKVETSFSAGQLDAALGMNSLTFSDVISSRESINISLLINVQKVLGVTIITRERMEEAFSSYLDYILRSS